MCCRVAARDGADCGGGLTASSHSEANRIEMISSAGEFTNQMPEHGRGR